MENDEVYHQEHKRVLVFDYEPPDPGHYISKPGCCVPVIAGLLHFRILSCLMEGRIRSCLLPHHLPDVSRRSNLSASPGVPVLSPSPSPVDHQVCDRAEESLSLIHISEPTRLGMISYAVFCLKK